MLIYILAYVAISLVVFIACRLAWGPWSDRGDTACDALCGLLWPLVLTLSLGAVLLFALRKWADGGDLGGDI